MGAASRAMRERPVVVERIDEGEDGRLRVILAFSERKSAELRDAAGEELEALLLAAVSEAVARLPGKQNRIVAHVPASLVEEFDELCRERGASRSGLILRRVSKYVGEDGRLLQSTYTSGISIPPRAERKDKRAVQIRAPAKQVEGFDRFCRVVGMKKDAFVMRQMLFYLKAAAKKAQRAGGGATGSPPAPTDPA
jgi:hypothetical protein